MKVLNLADLGNTVTTLSGHEIRERFGDHQLLVASPTRRLVYEVLRYAISYFPDLVVCEQDPSFFPVWEEIGQDLEDVGYDVKVLMLQSERPQRRAVLIASRREN